MAFTFASSEAEAHWSPSLKGALKWIADSGLGGERSSGWGRFEQPEFVEGPLGQLLFGSRYRAPEEVTGHWLLSLFSPAADDRIDWRQGNYRVVERTGRVQNGGAIKRANQMIAEGGVLVAPVGPKGTARDVAPAGFPHPVYRAGFALTLPIGKAKPAPPKVAVDRTLLESLASPEPPAAAPADDSLTVDVTASSPEVTLAVAEPRPSGSGFAEVPEGQGNAVEEPLPDGRGSVEEALPEAPTPAKVGPESKEPEAE